MVLLSSDLILLKSIEKEKWCDCGGIATWCCVVDDPLLTAGAWDTGCGAGTTWLGPGFGSGSLFFLPIEK